MNEELDIALIEAFLNSHDLDDRDWFTSDEPALFDDWATGNGAARGAHDPPVATSRAAAEVIRNLVVGHPATPAEVELVREARDCVIAMLLDGEPNELDRFVRELPVRMRVGMGSAVEVEPAARGPLGVAAAAMLAAHRLAVSGDWPRLRLCRSEDCHWAFFDRSKNHSRVWCSMGGCGARAKARAYRERQRTR